MNLTAAQRSALRHLRAAYVGPSEGDEEVLLNRPHLQYAVGMLFPGESVVRETDVAENKARLTAVPEGDVEEDAAGVPLAEDWRPSSVAISFVTDSPAAACSLEGGTYVRLSDDGPPRWQRRPFTFSAVELAEGRPPHQMKAGDVPLEIGARWRRVGGGYLVTVHVRVSAGSTGNDTHDIGLMLFQVCMAVTPAPGARFLEYDTSRKYDVDAESAELRLRYRERRVYAVGHGMAADWVLEAGECVKIFVDPVPAFVVPTVETTGFAAGSEEDGALRLDRLSRIDEAPTDVLRDLRAFVRSFEHWVSGQEARVAQVGGESEVARTIVARSRVAVGRMESTVELLANPRQEELRRAFALGMAAMRLQMRQGSINRGKVPDEPKWRPFQLGFLLVALASTVDESHEDRDLVDLIWFPTGGGKTEAYLGLAAVEIFRRRLVHGVQGGGTAVITRYTLRLLTAQQFQRAASLICAMEILRGSDPRAKGMVPFSIGLWVGNDVTPATFARAKAELERLHKAARPEEANGFQVESCPWCLAPLVPRDRSDDRSRYGFRLVGNDLVIHCTDGTCRFSSELPLSVVDDDLYVRPPTILLATVDKFARLQFKPQAGALLGLNSVHRQPSLVIQDELHLLSGPLGTTVAVFDGVIQLLLGSSGSSPKIVASTATIRSSDDQVKNLYGRKVALYPPSGLDDDRTFFSKPVETGEGRLYIGLMPQSMSQASSLVSSTAPLVELPRVLTAEGTDASLDSYWTLIMYHNSLRELGRTGTLVLDDVNGRLETRADRLGMEHREVRAGRVLELTSRRGPDELPNDLRELRTRADDSDQAIDVVLSSNMLSVGIDIPRLALMLMVGQPKTTAEYIQATSRVGRGDTHGIVVTLFRSNRARDRSQFESFRGYHEALYRGVEPTSVTPWSLASRDRSLAGALVALLRNAVPDLADDSSAIRMDLDDGRMRQAIDRVVSGLLAAIERADRLEAPEAAAEVWRLLRDWDGRAASARQMGGSLPYERRPKVDEALLKRFGQSGQGWLVGDSMRSVEPSVAVEVQEPMEEVHRAEDQA
ncbi:helicase-related protein [Modestobacter sp. SSW1-42]|uniref:helicase-related protein n=1 Tax=Modestobacter sp. SSW1-42 TaxID=596372 RepID=UPI0039863E46